MPPLPPPPLADSPRQALASYIAELAQNYYPWYDRKQRGYKRQWQILQTLTVVAGFGTSVLAALMQEKYFSGLGWGRLLLIILPSIGSLASTLLIQTRCLELMALRENGRRTMQYLLSFARLRYAALTDPTEISEFHHWLVKEITKLSEDQVAGFMALSPSRIDTSAKGAKPPHRAES